MFGTVKQNIIVNLKNIPGWRTDRKIVIIECDDWGGIRMPSKEVYDTLYGMGMNIATSRFNMFDTLESTKDLEMLFDVLNSVKDQNNKPAVMTPLTIVANPDFDKIKSTGFLEYYYEPFTRTLKSYYPDENIFKLWSEGINSGVFVPELHGRDHITVQLWMEKLREGNKELLVAFDKKFVALDIQDVPLPAREFRAEYYFTSDSQKAFLKDAIKESTLLFHEIFGYIPRVFVPGNGIFHPDFDRIVAESGIKFLNVFHSMFYPENSGNLKTRHFITGQRGESGIVYYTRNCAFEPTENDYKGIDSTLKQMEAAFRWGKPANISTHRANFTGSINWENRAKGLAELKKLLDAVVKKWPDAEFMGSGEALLYMNTRN